MHAFYFLKLSLRSYLSDIVSNVMLDRDRGFPITPFSQFFPLIIEDEEKQKKLRGSIETLYK